MLGRIGFIILFICGGFLFYIPKWIIMGTKGGRQRKQILKQQDEILRRTAAEK